LLATRQRSAYTAKHPGIPDKTPAARNRRPELPGQAQSRQETAMFTHPYIGSQLAREHHRDMLAQADQQRLVRQLRGHARASRRPAGTQPRLRRALRTALRLRPAADT
jgi:hypothetical protein